MVGFIFKRSDRELRERMAEAPQRFIEAGDVTRYARDPEEAYNIVRENHGLDNPNHPKILADDGGRAERELRDRTLRAAGYDPAMFED